MAAVAAPSTVATFRKQSDIEDTGHLAVTVTDSVIGGTARFGIAQLDTPEDTATSRSWSLYDPASEQHIGLCLADAPTPVTTISQVHIYIHENNPAFSLSYVRKLQLTLLATIASILNNGLNVSSTVDIAPWRIMLEISHLPPEPRKMLIVTLAMQLPKEDREVVSNGVPTPPTTAPDSTCAICQGSFGEDKSSIDSCEHVFCPGCIHEAANHDTRCPLCRKGFSTINVFQGTTFWGSFSVVRRTPSVEYSEAELDRLVPYDLDADAAASAASAASSGEAELHSDPEGDAQYRQMYGDGTAAEYDTVSDSDSDTDTDASDPGNDSSMEDRPSPPHDGEPPYEPSLPAF